MFLFIILSILLLTNCEPDSNRDKNGIEDIVENELLQRYSPYIFYDSLEDAGEDYRPCDALWYIQLSELGVKVPIRNPKDVIHDMVNGQTDSSFTPLIFNNELRINPNKVLDLDINNYSEDKLEEIFFIYNNENLLQAKYCTESDNITSENGWACGSDIRYNTRKTSFYLYPTDLARHGQSREVIKRDKNIGIYGHVVPKKLINPGNNEEHLVYYIEYWLFYGYNDTEASGGNGDHDGELECIRMQYDPNDDDLVWVEYRVHTRGALFNIDEDVQKSRIELNGTYAMRLRGENYGNSGNTHVYIQRHWDELVSNNTLYLCIDPEKIGTDEDIESNYTHPAVYVEEGSHASWPSSSFRWIASDDHRGNGHRIYSKNIPNLGEVGKPISNKYSCILHYNGYWGYYRNNHSFADVKPALHSYWSWPDNNEIHDRWREWKNNN